MRERVSYHQYHLLLPVTVFHSQLPMAPRHAQAVVSSTSISAWLAPSATDRFSPTPQLKTCGDRSACLQPDMRVTGLYCWPPARYGSYLPSVPYQTIGQKQYITSTGIQTPHMQHSQ